MLSWKTCGWSMILQANGVWQCQMQAIRRGRRDASAEDHRMNMCWIGKRGQAVKETVSDIRDWNRVAACVWICINSECGRAESKNGLADCVKKRLKSGTATTEDPQMGVESQKCLMGEGQDSSKRGRRKRQR
ncbi:hypothetical protein BCR44DRAFT_179196 [Catenaria anguillulae PL171]|uniref:Uncharacterized protein n=1 Tax=Catenaria anguillulae PL171 TaxID=765915 RepID=A0A1Y2H804_9FUNG|nr:hypothetical protein BCR44DRAFT_179196 [Catenaria anguillulae PL171]